jgi:hypothetical protein
LSTTCRQAEGCFFVGLAKSATNKLKEGVQLELQITQHSRDELLMKSLIKFFDCGNISKSSNVYRYRVSKISNLTNKIIPFFLPAGCRQQKISYSG